jgi:1-acyl-sn-glycerol-3-phosphate acyltransferase
MSLWDTMLSSRVAGRPFQRAERSLASNPALKLSLNFLRGALLERVGAADQSQACDRE